MASNGPSGTELRPEPTRRTGSRVWIARPVLQSAANIAPGKSDTFSVAVPAGGTPWIVLVGARKVTGKFDDSAMRSSVPCTMQRLVPVNLDSIAEKIPHDKIINYILRGPEMSDYASDG